MEKADRYSGVELHWAEVRGVGTVNSFLPANNLFQSDWKKSRAKSEGNITEYYNGEMPGLKFIPSVCVKVYCKDKWAVAYRVRPFSSHPLIQMLLPDTSGAQMHIATLAKLLSALGLYPQLLSFTCLPSLWLLRKETSSCLIPTSALTCDSKPWLHQGHSLPVCNRWMVLDVSTLLWSTGFPLT